MEFGLSDAQRLLRDSIAAFLDDQVDLGRVRSIAESASGHDRAVTRALGEQGIAGLLVDERWGGTGLGLLDASVAAQQMGRALTPVAFHSSHVLAPLLLEAAGSEAQKQAWLPRIANGEAIVAPVLADELQTSGPAELSLSGTAPAVPEGHLADAYLIPVSDHLWLVPADAAGITRQRLHPVDQTRPFAEVSFASTPLSEAWRLDAYEPQMLERAVAAARVALAADSLGACYEAIRIAVAYALEREQFGRVIGSFQAVKHLCAEMIAAVDPLQSLVWQAAWAWDQRDDEAAWLVPLLKAHAAEVGTSTVTTATQVFGGMGFTWECDMHLYFKRVGYDRQLLGGPAAMRALAAERQFGAPPPGAPAASHAG